MSSHTDIQAKKANAMFKPLMISALSALTAVVAIAAPAVYAGQPDDGRTAETLTVSLRNVDFQNPAQAEAAYNRLQAAAHYVCDSNSNSVFAQEEDRACERQAIGDALKDLKQPALYRVAARAGERTSQMAFNDRR